MSIAGQMNHVGPKLKECGQIEVGNCLQCVVKAQQESMESFGEILIFCLY